jgi:hypothetical protein
MANMLDGCYRDDISLLTLTFLFAFSFSMLGKEVVARQVKERAARTVDTVCVGHHSSPRFITPYLKLFL